MVSLSIVTPIITSGLGPAAQYGVNALPEPELLQLSYRMEKITPYAFAHKSFRVEKNIV